MESQTKPALSTILSNLSRTPISMRNGTFDNFHRLESIEISNGFSELLNFLDKQNIHDLTKELELKNILGKVFKEVENNNSIKDNGDVPSSIILMHFMKLDNNSATHQINIYDDNQMQFLDNNSEQLIGTKTSEWMCMIFEKKFGNEYKEKLLSVVNDLYNQNFNLNNDNQNIKTIAKPYSQDLIYYFLSQLTNQHDEPIPQFYLEKIGTMQQNKHRDKWFIFESNKEFELDDVDNLIQYMIDTICFDKSEEIRSKITLHLNTILDYTKKKILEKHQNVEYKNENISSEYIDNENNVDNLEPDDNRQMDDNEIEYDMEMLERYTNNSNNVSEDYDESDFDNTFNLSDETLAEGDKQYEEYLESLNYESKPLTEKDFNKIFENTFEETQEQVGNIDYNDNLPYNTSDFDNINLNKEIYMTVWQELEQFDYSLEHYFLLTKLTNQRIKPQSIDKNEIVFKTTSDVAISIQITQDNKIQIQDEIIDFQYFYPKLFNIAGIKKASTVLDQKNAVLNFIENHQDDLKFFKRIQKIDNELQDKDFFNELFLEDIVSISYENKLLPINHVTEYQGRPSFNINGHDFRFKENKWFILNNKNSLSDSKEHFLNTVHELNPEFNINSFINEFNAKIKQIAFLEYFNDPNFESETFLSEDKVIELNQMYFGKNDNIDLINKVFNTIWIPFYQNNIYQNDNQDIIVETVSSFPSLPNNENEEQSEEQPNQNVIDVNQTEETNVINEKEEINVINETEKIEETNETIGLNQTNDSENKIIEEKNDDNHELSTQTDDLVQQVKIIDEPETEMIIESSDEQHQDMSDVVSTVVQEIDVEISEQTITENINRQEKNIEQINNINKTNNQFNINEENIEEKFNQYVQIQKDLFLSKKRLCDNFSLNSFFELCLTNDNLKKYQINQINDNEYEVGKNKVYIDFIEMKQENNGKLLSVSELFAYVIKINNPNVSNEDIEKTLTRLEKDLEPIFDLKIKEFIQNASEEHLAKLIKQQNVSNDAVANKKETVSDNNQELHNANVKKNFNNIEKITDNPNLSNDEKWDAMFFKNKETQNQPLRSFLYNYELDSMTTRRVNVNFQHLINELIDYYNATAYRNDPHYIPLEKANIPSNEIKYSLNHVSMNIHLPNGLIIKATSGSNYENWEVLQNNTVKVKNNLISSGNSLMECLTDVILPAYKIKVSNQVLHNKIGKCLENQFYRHYPIVNLLLEYSSNITNNNAGQAGSMSWSYHNKSDTVRIWNGGSEQIYNGFIVAKLLAMQEMPQYRDSLWKDYVSNNPSIFTNGNSKLSKETNQLLNEKAKEIIKEHYFGLNSLQRKNMLTSIGGKNGSNNGDYDDYFDVLIPRPTELGTEKARNYLIEQRFLNPLIIDEFKGTGWYGGDYDYTYRQRFEPQNVKPEHFVNVVAFPNPLGSFIAVRGIDKAGPASTVKENVPGGHDNGHPIVIEPSKKYEFKDKNDPKSKHVKVVFCEAAIDGYSYRSLYPNAIVFAMSSANTSILTRSLEDAYDFIKKKVIEEQQLTYVYALDNIQLDENGVALDSTSRANYYKIMDNMGGFCWNKFYSDMQQQIDYFIENEKDGNCIEFTLNLLNNLNKYSNNQLSFAETTMIEYIENGNIANFNSIPFQRIIGKILFQFDYIDTHLFELAIPEHPELPQVKDWNEYLKELYLLRSSQNPTLSRQEIHDLITFEHSPELQFKNTKLEKSNKSTLKP